MPNERTGNSLQRPQTLRLLRPQECEAKKLRPATPQEMNLTQMVQERLQRNESRSTGQPILKVLGMVQSQPASETFL